MKKQIVLFLSIVVSIFASTAIHAQQRPVSGKGKLEYSGFFDTYYVRGPINFTLGAGLYKYGGTVNDIFGSNFNYGFSLGANYKIWPRTYLGADLTYLTLGASKDLDSKRNISFNTWGIEVAPFIRFNLIDDVILRHQEKSSDPRFFKPYAMLGVAGLYYNAASTYAPTDSVVASNYPAGTYKNTSPITLAIPIGLGGAFYINPKFTVLGELVYRYTLSDMLDAAKANPKVGNDAYISLSIKLQYTPEAKTKKKKPSFDGYLEPLSDAQKAKIDSANKAKRQQIEDQIKRQQFLEDSTRIADSTQTANEELEVKKKEEEELRKQAEEEERIRKQNEAPAKGKKKKSSSNNSWGTPAPANKKEEPSGW